MNLHELAKETAKQIVAVGTVSNSRVGYYTERAADIIESALQTARKQGMTDAADDLRKRLLAASKGEPDTWGFTSLFMNMIDEMLSSRDRLEPTKQ